MVAFGTPLISQVIFKFSLAIIIKSRLNFESYLIFGRFGTIYNRFKIYKNI
jgi:hypothetical protein